MRSPCQPSSILEASVATLTGFPATTRWSQHSWLSQGCTFAMAPVVGSSMQSTPPTTTRRAEPPTARLHLESQSEAYILLMISSSSSWPSSLNWLYTSIENEHPSVDNRVPRWAQLPIVDLCAIPTHTPIHLNLYEYSISLKENETAYRIQAASITEVTKRSTGLLMSPLLWLSDLPPTHISGFQGSFLPTGVR